ncbi:MAG: response regulator [Luminiphilus sp.]|nr:response regulator [Luminiphilus sp.]
MVPKTLTTDIGEQEQQRIFDPFTQLDSSLARRGGGVGLGLALCRDLARAMGGECTVASRRGEGATFEFSLPVTAVEMHAPAANITKDPVGLELTHRLLLVEDSAVNQMLTQALLETLGHSVALADDGYQAINLCSQEPFDVILMDLQMPGIDGLDTTRRIKGEAGPNQATPIIPLTANVGEEFHEKVKEVGMVGFIEKPIDRDQMAREIAAVMKASTNS